MVNSRARRRGVWVALVLLTVAGAWARAEAAARSMPMVRLYVAAAAPIMSALVERLQPRLGALGVELTANVVASVDIEAILAMPPGTTDDDPLAQVWVDGRASNDATLLLLPRQADRVLARRIPAGAAFDEVALSEIVFVIERAVSSLLASRPVGVPKAELDPSLRRRLRASAGGLACPPTPHRRLRRHRPPLSRRPSPPPPRRRWSPRSRAAGCDRGRGGPAADAAPVVASSAARTPPRASASFQLGAFAGTEVVGDGPRVRARRRARRRHRARA